MPNKANTLLITAKEKFLISLMVILNYSQSLVLGYLKLSCYFYLLLFQLLFLVKLVSA